MTLAVSKQWRKKTDAPTETGWYFGRKTTRSFSQNKFICSPIYPYHVRVFKNGKTRIMYSKWYGTADQYEWFGPVDEVFEIPCGGTECSSIS